MFLNIICNIFGPCQVISLCQLFWNNTITNGDAGVLTPEIIPTSLVFELPDWTIAWLNTFKNSGIVNVTPPVVREAGSLLYDW